MRTTYKHGDYVFMCDRCQHKRYASTGKWEYVDGIRTWFVCPDCWDRDKVRDNRIDPVYDDQTVPVARPLRELN